MFCEFADGKEIEPFSHPPPVFRGDARGNGFSETVAELCPNVTIPAEQPGNWNKDESQRRVRDAHRQPGQGAGHLRR